MNENTSTLMLTVKDVARALNISPQSVYRNKHALGAFQLTPGGAVRFPYNCIELKRKENAISDAQREMAREKDDSRPAENKDLSNKDSSQKMGSRAKRRSMATARIPDLYNLMA